MKLPLLVAAVLCAAVAAPSRAATVPNDDAAPKFDFTKKPELRPVLGLPVYDPTKPLSPEDADYFSDHVFALYQNIGSLSRFIHHKRTKDEPAMPAEDLAWATKELEANKAAADKVLPQAQTALRVGITRKPSYSEELRKRLGLTAGIKVGGLLLRARAVPYLANAKPPLAYWQERENDALSAVMCDLHYIVRGASARLEEFDAEADKQARKMLEEDLAELAEMRKNILAAQQEAEERRQLENSKVEEARERVNRASGGKLGADKTTVEENKDEPAPPSGSNTQIDPAGAARDAAKTPRAAPVKGKHITVPNP